jgi:hypothetical protein
MNRSAEMAATTVVHWAGRVSNGDGAPLAIKALLCGWLAATTLLVAPLASATLISYDVSNVAGSTWRYDYTITNDTLASAIDEFTVFFDLGVYANLSVAASPASWDSLVVQPDPGLPDNGFFDALALVTGIASNASLGGFSVRFDWLGVGSPGSQSFQIVDPVSFAVQDAGSTALRPNQQVAEPSSLALAAIALVMALGIGLRKRQVET